MELISTNMCVWVIFNHEAHKAELNTRLGILYKYKDRLEDMEGSEISSFLSHLPELNIDEVIHHANNLKHEIELMDLFWIPLVQNI